MKVETKLVGKTKPKSPAFPKEAGKAFQLKFKKQNSAYLKRN